MKRKIKSVLALFLCVLTLFPMTGLIFADAASVPAKVTGAKISAVTATSQKLTWDKVSSAKGYFIYQKKSGSYTKIASSTTNSFTVTGLNAGKKYAYKIKAYNNAGSSAASAAFSAYTVGKTAKISASAVSTTSIALTWGAVGKATGYRVYMLQSGTYLRLASIKGKTSYKVKNLKPGTDYSFKIMAYIKDSSVTTFGAYSDAKVITTVPSAVKGLTATPGSGRIALKWTKDANATGYQVYKYDSSKKAYTLVASLQSTNYTVTGLKASGTYKFKVRSFCSRYNTVYSEFSSVVSAKTLPAQVTISGDVSTTDSITVTWNKVSGATGYEVWALNGSKYQRVMRTTGNAYTRSGLAQGSKITVKVRAYTTSGSTTSFGEYSAPYVAATKPAAPANVKATGYSDDPIGVTWSAVSGATAYKIYRKTTGESEWKALTLTASTSYVDNNVSAGVTYQYKVQAYIAGSKNIYYSNYSNVASAEHKETEKSERTIMDYGVLGYLYNPDENYFYTANDPWQRRLGFTSLYDSFSATAYMWYTTERIRFSYANLDWMIQIWKGQYGYVFIGAEVGVYTKEKTREVLFYDCASDANRLKMSVEYYTRSSILIPYIKRFTTPYNYYWWCTGFIPGTRYLDIDRSNMRLDIKITMKDQTMLNAFTTALETLDRQSIYPFYQERYRRYNGSDPRAIFNDKRSISDLYAVNGLDVYFSY